MKISVGGFERLEIARLARGDVGEGSSGVAQAVDIPRRRTLAEPAHEDRLDRLANLENVANEIVVDSAHAGALIGIGDDEPLALKPPKRLPDRIGAHPIARRQAPRS